MKRTLVYFDKSWCRFEMPALEEIEAIHRNACRPLIEAIQCEQALTESEAVSLGGRGDKPNGIHAVRVEVQKVRFLEKVGELNQLANVEGKGRVEMDVTCLQEAERILARPLCPRLRRNSRAGVECGKAVPG